MRTWLTSALSVAVLGAAVMLWIALRAPAESVASPAAPAPARLAPPPGLATSPAAPPAAIAPPVAAEAPAAHEVVDPQSDAFFYRFDEVVPANLTRAAARCYEGARKIHRNQKLKLGYKVQIVKGTVTIKDVKVLQSTLDYPGLEACFIRAVSGASWTDDELPDWIQDDELVLRPERGMKKFSEANMAYEGDGPTGPAVMTAGQARPPSDTASLEDE